MPADRETLIKRLHEDLIGPGAQDEVLTSRPSDVYLTGILWPRDTPSGAESDDRLAVSSDGDGAGESTENDQTPQLMTRRPCSAGVSFAISSPEEFPQLEVNITFARYEPKERCPDEAQSNLGVSTKSEARVQRTVRPAWHRKQFNATLRVRAKSSTVRDGLPEWVELNIRAVPWGGSRLVTVTLINSAKHNHADGRDELERRTMFQVGVAVRPQAGAKIVARPSRASEVHEDDRIASVIYRNAKEYATGHTASAYWDEADGSVGITWIPKAVVHSVSADGHECFSLLREQSDAQPLSAAWLGKANGQQLQYGAVALARAYADWIKLQQDKLETLPEMLRDQARTNLRQCEAVLKRIRSAADFFQKDSHAALAFSLANLAMDVQFAWDPERKKHGKGLVWRPFQLGFLLLCLESTANRDHPDRSVMDLLWFPTGGGKTEAYLALVAFLSFYRRLRYNQAGVTALMRYTLRLLTTQQFARATAVMMACEAIRRRALPGLPEGVELGESFSIGLWVGGDATPNTFDMARAALASDKAASSPKQLAACPACASSLRWMADTASRSIQVRCPNQACVLYFGGEPLPVHTIDPGVYSAKPTLLVGTIDKFAQITRKEETNALFGIRAGAPPDLIIQDELHLISGPLGTLAAIYESAIDLVFQRGSVRTKIIGSTATIRRASEQVSALFDRSTCQFPPAAIDYDDSGFALVDRKALGRTYVGVTTAGRSAKFALQAVSASLLQSAWAGIPNDIRRDPYWTLVAYFNSLRELGGALVLVQDDVSDSISLYASARNENARNIAAVEELTSRRTQQEVVAMLSMLREPVAKGAALDVVLATNMLSVGVDIPRLGLMVVSGQPKGIAEYIQATSRVGRGAVPGLIVSVLNNAKARDRSHYEAFETWHSTLYRDVEATSVTPFAPRARDRALHAAVVSVVRHLVDGLLDSPVLNPDLRPKVSVLLDAIAKRASRIDPEEREVRDELSRIAKGWHDRAPTYYWNPFRPNQSLLQDAERAATLRAQGREPGEAWPTMNNLRSVEPSTPFRMTSHLSSTPRDGAGEQGQENDGDRW